MEANPLIVTSTTTPSSTPVASSSPFVKNLGQIQVTEPRTTIKVDPTKFVNNGQKFDDLYNKVKKIFPKAFYQGTHVPCGEFHVFLPFPKINLANIEVCIIQKDIDLYEVSCHEEHIVCSETGQLDEALHNMVSTHLSKTLLRFSFICNQGHHWEYLELARRGKIIPIKNSRTCNVCGETVN